MIDKAIVAIAIVATGRDGFPIGGFVLLSKDLARRECCRRKYRALVDLTAMMVQDGRQDFCRPDFCQ
jgi:hypothetical protein